MPAKKSKTKKDAWLSQGKKPLQGMAQRVRFRGTF